MAHLGVPAPEQVDRRIATVIIFGRRRFTTLDTPHELAHHVLVFRVHAAEPYPAVGSGLVTARAAGDVQEWVLDTKIGDVHRRWSKETDYKAAYDALGDEFDLARALIEARSAAGLSQSQLARRMVSSDRSASAGAATAGRLRRG